MKSRKETSSQKITIPERSNAPETKLFVKTLAHDVNALGSRPVILILPGGPGLDHSTYQSYNCLLDTADIVFHDPRGCGQSDKNDPATYTMENYVEDVEEIRKSLQLDKAIILGKSYGSVCALGYALRFKDSVERLILSAGAPSFRSLETAKENFAKIANDKQKKAYEKLWGGGFKSSKELGDFYAATASLYSNRLRTRLETYALTYFAKNFSYEAMNLGFSDFLRRFDFESQLHLIEHKTLIIAGQDDWINDIRHIQVMADKIPNNTFKVFADAGHAIESDIGTPYFETIRQFIISTEAPTLVRREESEK
ncbi:MAG: alpha/beta hydrolase [Gammaproteobacteria bacterium]|nr:alpha/beta hydrolase [Gammaproteobacteria bacterium]